MKKILSFAIIVLGMLAACDPSKDDISAPSSSVDADDLLAGFSYVQYSDETYTTEQADGNYFAFTTNPSRVVKIYQVNDEGEETVLSSGTAAGTFKLSPKRGSDSNQTIYIKSLNYDATEIVASTTVTVYVSGELSTEVRLLASDAYGSKVWKWDVDWRDDGGAWGNAAYIASDDGSGWAGNIWWGCAPADLEGQLNHSDTGVATGEESVDATMVFDEDGGITCYDAGGNQIRSGKYSVSGYTGERTTSSIDGDIASWCYGYLTTTEGSILFPFQINTGGNKPTQFEIMELDAGHLRLLYASSGTGAWGEATWWAFKSNSDAEGSLTNYSTKDWTWDTDWRDDGGAWGNAGYANGGGEGGWNGIWWACAPADLLGQLNHSDTGVATGEEDPDAYMTFDWNASTVTSYDAAGNQIRKGNFEISGWDNGNYTTASSNGAVENYAQGYLTTTAGSILFPFQINTGGNMPTQFEIVKLDADQMQLVYATEGTASWGEATWWAFKAK